MSKVPNRVAKNTADQDSGPLEALSLLNIFYRTEEIISDSSKAGERKSAAMKYASEFQKYIENGGNINKRLTKREFMQRS